MELEGMPTSNRQAEKEEPATNEKEINKRSIEQMVL